MCVSHALYNHTLVYIFIAKQEASQLIMLHGRRVCIYYVCIRVYMYVSKATGIQLQAHLTEQLLLQ